MHLRALATIALLVVLPVISISCSSRQTEPRDLLRNAVQRAEKSGTVLVEIDYQASARTGKPTAVRGAGELDLANKRSEYTMRSNSGQVTIRSISGRAFVSIPGAKGWVLSYPDQLGDDALSHVLFGSSPMELIAGLAAAAGPVTADGTETVDGQEMDRFLLEPNLVQLADKPGTRFLRDAEMVRAELWLDTKGRLARFTLEGTAEWEAGETDFSLEFTFHDYGAEVEIREPDSSELVQSLAEPGERVDPPCFGKNTDGCRHPSPELIAAYPDKHACDGTVPRLCILPVGDMPIGQIEALRAYLRDKYGLETRVLPPMDASDVIGKQVNAREWKVSYDSFVRELRTSYVGVLGSAGRIVGLTPVDMYGPGGDGSSFVFGAKRLWQESGNDMYGLVSTFRMNPQTFEEPPSDALWFERLRKLATKYVGLLYYGLEEDQVATSAMYQPIYSLRALDGITGHLPVPVGAPARVPQTFSTPLIAPNAPCQGADRTACQVANPQLQAGPYTTSGCDVPGKLVCIMAAGNVPVEQIEAAAAQLRSEGVPVGVVRGFGVDVTVDPTTGRVRGFDVSGLVDEIYIALEPRKEVSFLVLTPVDISIGQTASLGAFESFIDDGTRRPRYAVISTFRLNPVTYGDAPDDQLLQARINKLALRAAGQIYFDRPSTQEPKSPLFRTIVSLETIDAMGLTLQP